MNRLLSRPVLVWIGLISYPLYLWHWPLLTFARILHGEIPPAAVRILLLLASVLLAQATYAWLERPIRAHGRRNVWATPGFSAAMVVVALAGALVFANRLQSASASVPHVANVSEASLDWEGGKNGRLPGDSPRAVMFFGDSHMQQYWPRIKAVMDTHQQPVRTVVFHARGGCAPIPEIERRGYGCPEFVDAGFARAAEADVDIVVIAASWMGLRGRSDLSRVSDGQLLDLQGADEQWVFDRLEKALETLQRQGKTVVIVLSSPRDETLDPAKMLRKSGLLGWRVELSPPLSRPQLEAYVAPTDNRLREMARRLGATTVNPLDTFCSATHCPALSAEDDPLFKDATHIRASVVRDKFSALDRFIYLPDATTAQFLGC
ncbi:MAG: SGNH hydrolase domain-containing protein [Steroidobacteraceae bacterium]|nr:acyltransferase [Nevskiaceae bacterium]MCP5472945.1 acyltransferase [Nevskiaceae bacterium]